MPHEISIFLSTPSDIVEERQALSSLVSEVNDVVAFLTPEKDIRLKILHYETDSFPDIGRPQDVIDEQLTEDYDIYLGIMWKRAGTPTATEPSGTIHEFKRAQKRREKTGTRPKIMFFFCTEDLAMPTTLEEIDQLREVVEFRASFEKIGLAATYPEKAYFRERIRGRLLRAVADILRDPSPTKAVQQAAPEVIEVPAALQELCEQYDRVRLDMGPGSDRTRRMTKIFGEMVVLAPSAQRSLQKLKVHDSAGHRLAAIAIAQAFPSAEELAWLADRLDPEVEKPFVGFQAAAALLQAVQSLPNSDCLALRREVQRARDLAARNPDDPPRISTLDYALEELARKCGPSANPAR